ncbi:uncharacterized protein LOC114395878 isoform X1 [Glycine soja]|uniref:Uncharacterized protein n=2 Tax=Glycine subgen. Soja TaxID=1462606 RepID=K7MV38_SOYBN|nr:uncharacterized protein LOC114395878 isoform X1 [Glycine soja]XP_040868134.1 uncharacterized protein LOC100794762 isoform X1 [Glycine max]RZB53983.1 hypothetical protein D0Y65_049762 [Glycine soja]
MKRRNMDQMKITALSIFLLGCLLVMAVQGDSSARVLPAVTAVEVGNINKLGVSSQKEPFMRTGAGHHMRKQGLGGKKFSTNEVTSVDSKNGKGADGGETSKTSGKDNDGLKKSSGSRDQKNDDQKLVIMGPKEYLKSTKFVVPRRIPTSTYPKSSSQYCNIAAPVVKSSLGSSSSHEQKISEETPQNSTQKDETQRFADAAKEIAYMMNKDYHGRPSHRPPINNNEPRN